MSSSRKIGWRADGSRPAPQPMPLLVELGRCVLEPGAIDMPLLNGAIPALTPKLENRNAQYHSMSRMESSVRSGMFIATGPPEHH